MDHDYLTNQRRKHAAWRLLAAKNAPLIIGFFYRTFTEPNVQTLAQAVIEEKLDDYLYHLRQIHGEDFYPRPAATYLGEWAASEHAFLHKYYEERGDEPQYEPTPASAQAITWLMNLKQREFVGAESRLLTVIELLRDIMRVAETDPQQRIADLEARKRVLEIEIQHLHAGRFTPGDPRQIKERFFHAEDTARRLLTDFRQIEDNFRQLDRNVREKIATADAAKGALLDQVFDQRDAISDSDQGKSFAAFWALLMSPARQDELAELIRNVLALDVVAGTEQEPLLRHLHDHLLDAGAKVQRTSAALIEQLRRFLDDQVWLESKRIMDLIHQIETQAVNVHQAPPVAKQFMQLDELRVNFNLPLGRSLFRPTQTVQLTAEALLDGEAAFDCDALYLTHYVDEDALRHQVQHALRGRSQITLGELCEQHPVQKGLAEVLGYLRIASNDSRATIGADYQEQIRWHDPRGWECIVEIPKFIFTP
jgi:hypothetical protein